MVRSVHICVCVCVCVCVRACARAQLLQSCPTLCNPIDCRPPGPSVHGIFPARILLWVAFSFSRACICSSFLLITFNSCIIFFIWVYHITWASLVAQMAKNLPAMQETWLWSLGGEDLLKKGMTIHSSTLAWRIPWTEEPGGLSSWGAKKPDVTEQLTHTILFNQLPFHRLFWVFFNIYLFFNLFILLYQVSVVAHKIFDLHCSMWDLVPGQGIESWPPALGAWSLSHGPPGEFQDGLFSFIFPVEKENCLLSGCC